LGSPTERGELEMTPRSRRAGHHPTLIHRDRVGQRGSNHRRHLARHQRHHDAQQPTRHHAQPTVASKPGQARLGSSEPSEAGARCHSRGTTAAAGRSCLHRRRRARRRASRHHAAKNRRKRIAATRGKAPPPDGGRSPATPSLDCRTATTTPPHLRGTQGRANLRRAAPRRASRLRRQRRPAPKTARMGMATPPPPTPTGLHPAVPSGGGEEKKGWGGGC
jgi:hypothetical protein